MKSNLFICPKTYDLNSEIIEGLNRKNFSYDILLEKTDSSIIYFLCKIGLFRKIISSIFSLYIFIKIKINNYDRIYIIRGYFINIKLINWLEKNKNLKITIYQWDSFENYNYSKFFNRGFRLITFSPFDSKLYNLEYFPLFSEKLDLEEQIKNEFNIAHVGTFSSIRLKIFKLFINDNAFEPKDNFLMLYLPFLGYLKFLIFNFKKPLLTRYKQISKNKLINYYAKSNCILDIMTLGDKAIGEAGVSINVIRALALNKKIVTNNKGIEHLNIDKSSYLLTDFSDILNIVNFAKDPLEIKPKFKFSVDNWLENVL